LWLSRLFFDGEARHAMTTDKNGRSFLTSPLVYGPALGFLALTLVANQVGGVDLGLLTRDMAATLNAHPLTGVQSNLGVLVWWAAASVSFFSAAILHQRQGDGTSRSFLLWSGIVTAVLALDDFFMFHDELAPRHLRTDQNLVQLGIVALAAWHLFRFRHHILCCDTRHLLLSMVFFGASLTIDSFQESWSSPLRIFFEDGFKLLGIVSWSAYIVQCCLEALSTPLDVASDSTES